MQTCETCKYKYFRNVIVPGTRNRDMRHVCAFGAKNPNKGYVKSITRHNPATLQNEFFAACENFEKERHLTPVAADTGYSCPFCGSESLVEHRWHCPYSA